MEGKDDFLRIIPTIMTTKEAARYLSFSYKTLESWRAAGKGPQYLQLDNRRIRYKREHLDEWLHINASPEAA